MQREREGGCTERGRMQRERVRRGVGGAAAARRGLLEQPSREHLVRLVHHEVPDARQVEHTAVAAIAALAIAAAAIAAAIAAALAAALVAATLSRQIEQPARRRHKQRWRRLAAAQGRELSRARLVASVHRLHAYAEEAQHRRARGRHLLRQLAGGHEHQRHRPASGRALCSRSNGAQPLEQRQQVAERLATARRCDAHQVTPSQAGGPAAALHLGRRRQATVGQEGLQPVRQLRCVLHRRRQVAVDDQRRPFGCASRGGCCARRCCRCCYFLGRLRPALRAAGAAAGRKQRLSLLFVSTPLAARALDRRLRALRHCPVRASGWAGISGEYRFRSGWAGGKRRTSSGMR